MIPNLARTVRGYRGYESETLEKVAEKRTDPDSMESRSPQENTISPSLSGRLAVAESYPDLKASQTFILMAK